MSNRPWEGMRRCVLNANGTVNYYLDPNNSALKEDGITPSVLDGTDGNVMVEIPKFYYQYTLVGTLNTFRVSRVPLPGYTLHPAFVKAGIEVPFRYIGSYDACLWDDSAGQYVSGLNLDNMSANIDLAADKLASVADVYPLVGVTRPECRTLAANNGAGWHQMDFYLWSAVQMLFFVERASFRSQTLLGAGNTNISYLVSSADQNDSPHTIAGASTSWGNTSTDGTQPSAGSRPGTAFMSYRGIENFYGNCWTFIDGVNINVGTVGTFFATNDYRDFADNTSTNHTLLSSAIPTTSGFIRDIATEFFLPVSTTGGSSTTFITDQYFASTSLNRILLGGGAANSGASAGAFGASGGSSDSRNRSIGARLCY
jgi:hypothetical protein